MKVILQIIAVAVALGGLFLLLTMPREITLQASTTPTKRTVLTAQLAEVITPDLLVSPLTGPADRQGAPEADLNKPPPSPVGSTAILSLQDEEVQPRLLAPPTVVRGIYLTGWVAGSPARVAGLVKFMKEKDLNAAVIDVKDYSGHVSYQTGLKETAQNGAEGEIRIPRPNVLLKELHANGIYAIGRITIFQDPILARAHPEWAMKDKATGAVWKDQKGLVWMDPAAAPVWDYNIQIARDALARGFDEINFDYVRFASDGNLQKISFPYWNGITPRHEVIGGFFKYLRENLGEARLSADLFGLTTVNRDDLGIGQVIEDAYRYFDFVCPMVYPSHYAPGFLGYANPAKYPFEVIEYSMKNALARWNGVSAFDNASFSSSTVPAAPAPNFRARLRPWLQDFDLGATYNGAMVEKEIRAVEQTLFQGTAGAKTYGGWLLWDPRNVYSGYKDI